MEVANASVSRPLTVLAKDLKLVSFVPDDNDFRIKHLYLAPKGESLKRKLEEIIK